MSKNNEKIQSIENKKNNSKVVRNIYFIILTIFLIVYLIFFPLFSIGKSQCFLFDCEPATFLSSLYRNILIISMFSPIIFTLYLICLLVDCLIDKNNIKIVFSIKSKIDSSEDDFIKINEDKSKSFLDKDIKKSDNSKEKEKINVFFLVYGLFSSILMFISIFIPCYDKVAFINIDACIIFIFAVLINLILSIKNLNQGIKNKKLVNPLFFILLSIYILSGFYLVQYGTKNSYVVIKSGYYIYLLCSIQLLVYSIIYLIKKIKVKCKNK